MTAPAFKEWQVIVDALGSGRQSIILRKGGIAEGRGGFQIKHRRFWLFPTRFHAQLEKVKPEVATWSSLTHPDAAADTVTLRYQAELIADASFTDWETIARLDSFHFWSEETIRERFASSTPPSIHGLWVRVHQTAAPITLPVTPEMGGCKSWIDVPVPLEAQPLSPVLTDTRHTLTEDSLRLFF